MTDIKLREEETCNFDAETLSQQTACEIYQRYDSWINVEFPNPRNDFRYTLRPKGWIGHLPLSSGQMIRIEPKLGIRSVFGMLEYAYKLKSFELLSGSTTVSSLEEMLEQLASMLALRVLDRVRTGLHKGYVQIDEVMGYVRGKILVAQSLQAALGSAARLHCEFEEHTADLDDNRILAWTLHQLLRMPLRREDVVQNLRSAYQGIAPVVEVRHVAAQDCVERFYHRLNDDYRPMHGLCRFFLDHCGAAAQSGDHNFLPFRLYMPNLFETFVGAWLQAHLPAGFHLETQRQVRLNAERTYSFRIDLVLSDSSGRVVAVLDTKYKQDSRPLVPDIQQMVAYAASLATETAILIYPSAATAVWHFQAEAIHVHTMVFDLAQPHDQAGRAFLDALLLLLPAQ